MQYNFIKFYLAKKLLKKKTAFCFKSSTKINNFFLNKVIYIRKGLYFRKVIFNKYNLGNLTSYYLLSRKPFNRSTKIKKR